MRPDLGTDHEFHVCPPRLTVGMRTMIICQTVHTLAGDRPWHVDAARAYADQHPTPTLGRNVSYARAVLTWCPELADAVATGKMPLGIAYRTARRRQRAAGVSVKAPYRPVTVDGD